MRIGLLVASALLATYAAASEPALAGALQSGIIDGRVTGPNGQPVENAHVTLTDDAYSPLASKYTDSSGRFRFSVSSGIYYVDVDAAGKPYKSQRQRVEVNPAPFGHGQEIFRADFTLAAERPRGDRADPSGGGVRFAQKVPDPARVELERGRKLLADKPDEAYAAMRKAIEIFPDYYDAMETLGVALVKADRNDEAKPILAHAVEVNPSGGMSHYGLGVISYKQGRFADAIGSFQRAATLDPKNANAPLYLGLAFARDGRTADAETALKRAYELGATGVPELHLALAQIYINSNRPKLAADQLKLLLKEVPTLRDKQKIKDLVDRLEKKAAGG